jgi:uncharacterized membrane protein YkoI
MPYLKRLAGFAVLSLAIGGGAATAFAYDGQELAGGTSVSLQVARVAALKAVPGRITAEELEKEGGGSGLRYSFDIELGGATHEVGVDAKTGKILENSREGPNPD